MKDDGVYLTHIVGSTERVEQYTASGKEGFFKDPKAQAPTSTSHRFVLPARDLR